MLFTVIIIHLYCFVQGHSSVISVIYFIVSAVLIFKTDFDPGLSGLLILQIAFYKAILYYDLMLLLRNFLNGHFKFYKVTTQWSYYRMARINLQSHPIATLAPQARQARASGENLNYVTLAPWTRLSGEILNYLLSR